ncbi:asparaginase [Achlya hypogyna]|uniref:Asparaginase n=1 Tax=Achlya hypogyna TaxID=1202772 RepID=A0A1V9ZMH0_ACHHY|nr:asparaginase [Achlya hypogyna]
MSVVPAPDVDASTVTTWIDFMHTNGVRHVLCLLTKEELGFYSTPLLDRYATKFGAANVTHVDVARSWQLSTLLQSLTRAVALHEKIVVHCSTGQSRTANVLALWLHRHNALGIAEAVNEVTEYALEARTTRKPRVADVVQMLMGEQPSASLPPPPTSARPLSSRVLSGRLATGAPDTVDICFIQMGGAIDRRTVVSQRFSEHTRNEIGDSCVREHLAASAFAVGHEFVSVCKREGADVTLDDRKKLLTALFQTSAPRIVVTHSLETLLETAQFVALKLPTLGKVVVFTGARLPAIENSSDAAFHVGFAAGACGQLRPGVYVAAHGRVIPATACLRNERSGLFEELKHST